jgi:hypothetical protein
MTGRAAGLDRPLYTHSFLGFGMHVRGRKAHTRQRSLAIRKQSRLEATARW